ncbi:universal stress protein [Chthonobacter albigriseus]|uniref:universal stress protein n=1 Tax=Chthonobacter albigriseus TaxID=1683161 RepID=UPI0015EF4D99|nr:universal stress protein [Chthonobacter albigriseus]
MPVRRIAYLPLNSYPEAVAEDALRATVGFAVPLGVALHVTTFAVDIPKITSPLAGLMLDVPGMVRAAEEHSRDDCRRLGDIARAVGAPEGLTLSERTLVLGAALDAAAQEARYFDLSLLPWSRESQSTRDMAEAVVFGSGRPAILVPPSAQAEKIDHLAVAWDGSRVASRALGDALALLRDGGRITVLTVKDEKPLTGRAIAGTLATCLENRGFVAQPAEIDLRGRPIGEVLQDEALKAGASLLAMGGFGHSRLRDFILGGATAEVFADLRLPVLLSH